jgi:hypothetical protein
MLALKVGLVQVQFPLLATKCLRQRRNDVRFYSSINIVINKITVQTAAIYSDTTCDLEKTVSIKASNSEARYCLLWYC